MQIKEQLYSSNGAPHGAASNAAVMQAPGLRLIEQLQRDNEPAPVAAPDFDELLRANMDELLDKTRAHQKTWRLGQEKQWHLDLGSGELVWSFPEVTAWAPAQVIGFFDSQTGIWKWAWADASLPEHLKEDALRVRQYGEQYGFERLVVAEWDAQETDGWYMAALACWLCGAQGAYRREGGNGWMFMTFGPVDLRATGECADERFGPLAEQAAADFKACAGSLEEIRRACCRYFKRGADIGLAQDELIQRLGLAAPSVLDMAGFSPDAAEQVMHLIGRISNEEIESCEI